MMEDLEKIKLQAEIDKINAETRSLRRPFSKPSDWISVVLGIGGVLTAIGQWQVTSLQKEKTALQAERRAFDAEKLQRETDTKNKDLAQQLAKQQEVLSDIDGKIQERKVLLASLATNAAGSSIPEGTRNLLQQAQTLDNAISDKIQDARTYSVADIPWAKGLRRSAVFLSDTDHCQKGSEAPPIGGDKKQCVISVGQKIDAYEGTIGGNRIIWWPKVFGSWPKCACVPEGPASTIPAFP